MDIKGWLKWRFKGKPMRHYEGYNCGLCGKWCIEPFDVPTYKSRGWFWDTWGICKECAK